MPHERSAGWLTYIASDELQGRAVFTAGYGLAVSYVADHLHAWGVKPAGDHGSYVQTVRVLGVKTNSHSTVTVTVNGESRTFADGDAISFPRNMGGKQRFTVDRVEFAGYGLEAPAAHHTDFDGKNVKGAAVVWLGSDGPEGRGSGGLSARADGTQPIRDRAARRRGEPSDRAAENSGRWTTAGAAPTHLRLPAEADAARRSRRPTSQRSNDSTPRRRQA